MAKPKRRDFTRASDWLTAVLGWLEHRWPDNQQARIDAWRRIDQKAQAQRLRGRMTELIAAPVLTDAEAAELDGLIDDYMTQKRRDRAATRLTKGNDHD